MDNPTKILARSRKTTNIYKTESATTSRVSSHQVFRIHKDHRTDEHQEEEYVASTVLSASPKTIQTVKKSTNFKRHSEHILTKIRISRYTDKTLPKSEGAAQESVIALKTKESVNGEVLPNLLHKYVSVPDLNSPSEIQLIENNVRQNEMLAMLNEYRSRASTSEASSEEISACNSIIGSTDPSDEYMSV